VPVRSSRRQRIGWTGLDEWLAALCFLGPRLAIMSARGTTFSAESALGSRRDCGARSAVVLRRTRARRRGAGCPVVATAGCGRLGRSRVLVAAAALSMAPPAWGRLFGMGRAPSAGKPRTRALKHCGSASAYAANDLLELSAFYPLATLVRPPITIDRAEDPNGQTLSVTLATVFAAPPVDARAPVVLTFGPCGHAREYLA
jgi:hypothetical protein